MKPKVSIVIPTKDRLDKLEKLLFTINKSTIKPLEVIIINNSTKKLELNCNKYKIIENCRNNGLAEARTIGAKQSKGEFILFIDDDNIIDQKLIFYLQKTLDENSNIMAVGPLTFYLRNKKRIWFLAGKINLLTSKASFIRFLNNDKNTLYQTDVLHNCFMVRKKLGMEVSWFDNKIFMSGTEYDMFKKIKIRHSSMYLATSIKAKCYHDVPEMDKDLLRSLGFENPLRVYYFQRNRGLIIGRFSSKLNRICFGVFFYPLFFIIYSLLFVYKKKFDYLISHSKATYYGYKLLIKP